MVLQYVSCKRTCYLVLYFDYLLTWNGYFVLFVSVNGLSQRIVLLMPLFLSKFFTPTEMTSQDFFSRWKQLGK